MNKIEIKTTCAPSAIGPYSQAIEAGGMIFLSGQIPVNPNDGSIAVDIVGQANQVFKNINGILEEAKISASNVVKTTVFLTDLNNFTKVNEIYANYFNAPYPSRSCIEVSKLPKGVLIEVEAIAIR
ncbi:MAG: RidA family protein [Clostridia bacterium]